ncbi:hypothetical protein Salat_1594200 [Sesamum alatum]|uniref:Uncharacterized protein n=1 Tax=Sesamum alatum TaxID=300844 RepID=A0AAE2CJ28_9LAMI|nr:hypothetical protein Salat_1594200 [Sesamum alatum]
MGKSWGEEGRMGGEASQGPTRIMSRMMRHRMFGNPQNNSPPMLAISEDCKKKQQKRGARAALRWVHLLRENDPNRVSHAGPSAGAGSELRQQLIPEVPSIRRGSPFLPEIMAAALPEHMPSHRWPAMEETKETPGIT